MKLCSWTELNEEFSMLDKSLPVKYGVIVFNPEKSNWRPNEYSLISRCYIINSGAKYFDASMCGSSIFADCMDGTDQCVKLSNYLSEWHSDYCVVFDNVDELKEFKNDPESCINKLKGIHNA